jgi:hypothetical protein
MPSLRKFAISSYSMDLRVRVLKESDAGMFTYQVAEKYQISPALVRLIKQRQCEWRSSRVIVVSDMLFEEAGAVESALEVGPILKFAHL